MNKCLLILILILIPILIISFFKEETIFYDEISNIKEEILIPVQIKEEIIHIPLEEYVLGVVAGEMPALFEFEALCAQAIAARTYVINHLSNNSLISTTINDQVYITQEEMQAKWQNKYEEYYNKIKSAIDKTSTLIMYYNNTPIKAYYYSMSNGYTESSKNVFNEENEYLKIIPSPFDSNNENTITMNKTIFCENLKIKCDSIIISNIEKDESNRVSYITINNNRYTGIEVRSLLSLRSTDFTIIPKDEYIEIITKGYGHGVGMSQYGANNMAKEGYNYEEILKYYYKNIEINSI